VGRELVGGASYICRISNQGDILDREDEIDFWPSSMRTVYVSL
jgi:hypothetical protein